MARRRVQYVLVCEDRQHESFVRQFLKASKLLQTNHQLRIERAPLGRGAADQFVRNAYVTELQACRRSHVAHVVILMLDGDKFGVHGRLRQLDDACRKANVQVRSTGDKVAVFIPTWNIETWLAYLEGQDIDEGLSNYDRLENESNCKAHVERLVNMCRRRILRVPAPDSLEAACQEYDSQLHRHGRRS